MSRSGAAQGALSMGAEPLELSRAAWTCRGRDGAGTRRGRWLHHALTAPQGHPGTEHLVPSKGPPAPRPPAGASGASCGTAAGRRCRARTHCNREPSVSWATTALPSQTAAPSSGRLVGTKRLSSPSYGFGFSPSVQARMFQSFVKCLF